MHTATNRITDYLPSGSTGSDLGRRGRQTQRLLLLASELMGARDGLSVAEAHERVTERTGGRMHARTVRRDLQTLEGLGHVEHAGNRFYWTARRDRTAEAVLSAVAADRPGQAPRECGHGLQEALDRLPPPWQMTAEEMRAATEAVRILALLDTRDLAFGRAVLVFKLGDGWKLRRPGYDLPESPLISLASELGRVRVDATDALREIA